MKKIISLLLVALVFSGLTFAQKPQWTDPNYRQNRYSQSLYLTGFASSVNSTGEDPAKMLDKLADYAKTKLIQSIQVTIKSIATMETENIDTKTHEHFKLTSVSFSKADIAGLKYERYYDKKNKEAYAFAYAKKSEVIAYYKNTISNNKDAIAQKIKEGRQFVSMDDKQNALKTYYECMPLFREIEEAQTLLIALGQTAASYLYIDQVDEYKMEVKKAISELQSNKQLNMSDVCYFMAYGMFLQTDETDQRVILNPFTYRDTEMKSDFSDRFDKTFERKLIDVAKYKVKHVKNKDLITPNNYPNSFVLEGTYWEEGTHLKIIAIMRNLESGKAVASAEGQLPISWLKSNDIKYIPQGFQQIEMIDKIKLTPRNAKYEVKLNQLAVKPLELTATYSDETGNPVAVPNLPVKFTFMADDSEIATVRTDNDGFGKCFLNNVEQLNKLIMVKAELNVAEYVGVEEGSEFYEKVIQSHTVPSVKFMVRVSGLSVYMEASEKQFGYPLEVKMIEPRLKEALSQQGYTFVEDMSQAELYININASSRRGSVYNGMYSSYVDANVSVMDMETGKEVYKNSFAEIKGMGLNYRQGSAKAYKSAADKVSKGIAEKLLE